MAPIRRLADVIIDTTKFNVHELRAIHHRPLSEGEPPAAADFRGEFRIPLRHPGRCRPGFRRALSSQSPFRSAPAAVQRERTARVARYIRSFPQTGEFLRRIESLLAYLIPHYIREGKSYLTIALGCTGGRHRSVALAEVIQARAAAQGIYRRKSCIAIWINRRADACYVLGVARPARLRLARCARGLHRLVGLHEPGAQNA